MANSSTLHVHLFFTSPPPSFFCPPPLKKKGAGAATALVLKITISILEKITFWECY